MPRSILIAGACGIGIFIMFVGWKGMVSGLSGLAGLGPCWPGFCRWRDAVFVSTDVTLRMGGQCKGAALSPQRICPGQTCLLAVPMLGP